MIDEREARSLWEEHFKRHGSAWLTVRSGSMHPMIPVGARVMVARCGFDELKAFDIVLFQSGKRLITHRVLEKKGDHLLQSGDNASRPYLVPRKDILGRVICIESGSWRIDLQKKRNQLLNAAVSVNCLLTGRFRFLRKILLTANWALIWIAPRSWSRRCVHRVGP